MDVGRKSSPVGGAFNGLAALVPSMVGSGRDASLASVTEGSRSVSADDMVSLVAAVYTSAAIHAYNLELTCAAVDAEHGEYLGATTSDTGSEAF